MNDFKHHLQRMHVDQNGATSIEYALVGVLIAVVCVGAVVAIGGDVSGLYTRICREVTNAVSGAPAC